MFQKSFVSTSRLLSKIWVWGERCIKHCPSGGMALKKKLIWDFRRNLKAKIVPIELYFLKVVFKILSGRRWVIWWGGMGGISHKICIMKGFTAFHNLPSSGPAAVYSMKDVQKWTGRLEPIMN